MKAKVYGSRVVGEEKAAELLAQTEKKNRFGPRVLGTAVDDSEEAEERRAEVDADAMEKRLATQQSRRVRQAPTLTPADEERLEELLKSKGGSAEENQGYVSIDDLKDVLKEMPEAYDRLLGWELNREGGPRIGALTHFLELEVKREGGPRAPVQSRVEQALTAARSKD